MASMKLSVIVPHAITKQPQIRIKQLGVANQPRKPVKLGSFDRQCNIHQRSSSPTHSEHNKYIMLGSNSIKCS